MTKKFEIHSRRIDWEIIWLSKNVAISSRQWRVQMYKYIIMSERAQRECIFKNEMYAHLSFNNHTVDF